MGNINQRLNGLNPLANMGVNATQPSHFRTQSFDPGPNDSKNFYVGAWWLNTRTLALWYLGSLAGNAATWLKVTLAGIITLTGNTGGAVSADALGNINVVGDGVTATIVGVPATHTLTVSVIGGIAADSFPTDAGTAAPVAGVLNIFGGTAGRDINTTGSGNTVHVHLNNAITLGDLVGITGSPAITLTTGDATITAGNINISDTNSAGTIGVIKFGGDPFIHNFGTDNVFVGDEVGNFTLTAATHNSGFGTRVLSALTTGGLNSSYGANSMSALTTGSNNCAFGFHSMMNATTLSNSTFVGYQSGVGLISGDNNVGIGTNSFSNLTVGGTDNTGLGTNSGNNHTLTDSNNICIGTNVLGVAGQSNTARIGNIRGVTTNVNDAVAVLIDSTGQLGTVSSSRRFKENIEGMGSYSDVLLDLRPVVFNYKKHSPKDKSVGLIAEEVELVAPNLVVFDNSGIPETVKYQDLVPMMLNEIQKMATRIRMLEDHIDRMG